MKQEKQPITDCDDFPSPISQQPINEFPFWERMYEVSMTKDDHYVNRPFPHLTFDIKVGANDIANSYSVSD